MYWNIMHMCKNQIALSTENANTETQYNTAVWGHFRARLPESEIQALAESFWASYLTSSASVSSANQ